MPCISLVVQASEAPNLNPFSTIQSSSAELTVLRGWGLGFRYGAHTVGMGAHPLLTCLRQTVAPRLFSIRLEGGLSCSLLAFAALHKDGVSQLNLPATRKRGKQTALCALRWSLGVEASGPRRLAGPGLHWRNPP